MTRPVTKLVPPTVGPSVLAPLRPLLRVNMTGSAEKRAAGREERNAAGRPRQAAAALRAETILALHVEGRLTHAEIAAEVGVSRQRVHQIIAAALAMAAAERGELAEFALERELLVIDATMREACAIFLRKCDACGGDEERRTQCRACKKTGFFYPVRDRLAAIDRCGRSQERRIKLLGLKCTAQAQAQRTADPRDGRNRDHYAELEKLSDEELDEQMRSMVGDLTPTPHRAQAE